MARGTGLRGVNYPKPSKFLPSPVRETVSVGSIDGTVGTTSGINIPLDITNTTTEGRNEGPGSVSRSREDLSHHSGCQRTIVKDGIVLKSRWLRDLHFGWSLFAIRMG